MATIEVIERTSYQQRFRVYDVERGYCDFTVWPVSHYSNGDPVPERRLSSFGGSAWPGHFPEFFEHFGDRGVINVRSGYMLRKDVADAILIHG